MTFLELFARAYLSPQEISVESGVPLDVVFRMRKGEQTRERDVRRVLRVVNSRLEKPVFAIIIDPSEFGHRGQ